MTAWVWKAGALESHETPGNAKGNAGTVTASPGSGQVNGSRTSNASATLHNGAVTVTSRSVTPGLGSVQALPWSGLVTEDSLKAHDQGGQRARLNGFISPAGRSPNFPHPQLAGRPWRPTSGGVWNARRGPLFQDRPLNCLFINVQKKGDSGAQKTQPKPIHNPLGFHGSSHG